MLIWSAPLRYKTYSIPKRQAGKFRQVSQPTPEVKLLQRWLIANFFPRFQIHKAATAYRLGVGLVANVQPHAKNRFLLKIDFSDFFPSIKSKHFVQFMRSFSFSAEDIDIARHICFKRNQDNGDLHLAIGAPSSPILSNLMLHSLDLALWKFAADREVTFTRYADDLSFSCNTPNVLQEVEAALPELIATNCIIPLQINVSKTVHASKKNGRTITGLVITPQGNLSVGLARKKLLRSQIYRYKTGILPVEEIEPLRGYIAFLNSVEPSHVQRMVSRYGIETIAELFPGISQY